MPKTAKFLTVASARERRRVVAAACFALGGDAPTIRVALLGLGPDQWMPVAAFVIVANVVAAIATTMGRETYRVPMNEPGRKAPVKRFVMA
jgi:hypothetical protein